MKLARYQRPDLWSWSPFDQLSSLRDEINRLFELPSTGNGSDVFNTWAPSVDLFEDKDHLILKAELPGMKKDQIDVSIHDNAITISGERQSEKKYGEGSEASRSERFFGRFQRTLTLPKKVDSGKIKAAYRDGILTVTLPKAEEAKPRQIAVNAS
jgi:HSP20 family protein